MNRRRRARAFTLVEVLVALAMVAIALTASLRALGSMAQTNRELRLRFLAQTAVENRINAVFATRVFPPLGQRTLECDQADVKLVCEEVIKPTPNTVFRRIEVRAHEPGDNFTLARLAALIPEGL